MHSGFGAASGTIHLLPKGLAMPCGWLLGHGQIPAPSIYHPGWLLGQKSAATYPPTASPTAGWGGETDKPRGPAANLQAGSASGQDNC